MYRFPIRFRPLDDFFGIGGRSELWGAGGIFRLGARPVGYSFRHWLFYGTSGFAWTHDQFTRAQAAGTPVGGPRLRHSRIGASVANRLDAWRRRRGSVCAELDTKFEYLFADFGSSSVSFPAGAQRFTSDLAMNEVRLGVNYSFGEGAAKWWREKGLFSIHGQSTCVNQYAPGFHEPYRGPNSLIAKSGRETWDATLYAGVRLWQGAEVWINPEIDQGFGLSKTLGVAGFPSGEAYKVGDNYPYARVPRCSSDKRSDLAVKGKRWSLASINLEDSVG